MAAKLVLLVAMVASCLANPVLISGVYRDGRAYSVGQAYSLGGGVSTAQAKVADDAAQAYSSANGGAEHLSRDGYYYPQQAVAQAQSYNTPTHPAAQAVAQAHNGAYYAVPQPATVVTYEQNFAVPQVTYSTVLNGAPESSEASATSNGNGNAKSSAITQGGLGAYGVTTSNAETSGTGIANSKANSGPSSTSTSANSQGHGTASSRAQVNNGLAYRVIPVAAPEPVAVVPTVIDAKSPVFHTAYVPVVPAQGVASANANVHNSGNAAASAKIGHGRTISWRFGTLYDTPAGYSSAKSAAHSHGYGASSANANANSNGYGYVKSAADAQLAGYNSAQSSANAAGAGSALANADVSGAGRSAANSAANSVHGTAASSANVNSGYGGVARAGADVHPHYLGGSRTSADAHSQGAGTAASSARTQALNAAYRVGSSQAHSSGFGSAHAQTLTV